MMHLEGDRQLHDFELFLVGIDFDSSYYEGSIADDDIEPPAWEELERDAREEYGEMEQARKAQQAASERRRFEQAEKRVQQQLHELDVLHQDQLKQLLHLQQDQLKQVLLQRDQMEADMPRPVESSPPSSSSALGFSTPRYYMPPYSSASGKYDLASSSSSPPFSTFSYRTATTTSLSSSSSSSSPSQSYVAPSAPSSHPEPAQPPSRQQEEEQEQEQEQEQQEQEQEQEQEEEDEPSIDNLLLEQAMALATDWSARREDMERYVLQQVRQQQEFRAGNDWLSFYGYHFGWPRVAATPPGEESARGGSSSGGAGGPGQKGVSGEGGFGVGREGLSFEEAAAASVVAVKA